MLKNFEFHSLGLGMLNCYCRQIWERGEPISYHHLPKHKEITPWNYGQWTPFCRGPHCHFKARCAYLTQNHRSPPCDPLWYTKKSKENPLSTCVVSSLLYHRLLPSHSQVTYVHPLAHLGRVKGRPRSTWQQISIPPLPNKGVGRLQLDATVLLPLIKTSFFSQ
jgi:hypothetical protein